MRVDLYLVGGGGTPPPWPHGDVHALAATPADVARALDQLAVDAALFWDPALGPPLVDQRWFATRRAEVVHAGLALGQAGRPTILDYIQPTWMWNRDVDARVESTSWRISLRACFVRREVVQQLGGLRREFHTLDAAALELGHRYISCGAFVRHEPLVAPQTAAAAPIPLHDELLFAHLRNGTFWARWALGRGLLARDFHARHVPGALRAFDVARSPEPTFRRPTPERARVAGTVSIVIPTIERYPYLRTLLGQLATQTHPPHEILVIDQTPAGAREALDPIGLPVRVVYQDMPGQCTARNHAIRIATGDYLLFLDDDDEVGPTLIEDHLRCVAVYRADVSCGVSNEVGAGPLQHDHRFLRASDGLSTNNSLMRRDVLRRSGLFDIAYDRKQCEDFDLGMRLYLDGAFAVRDPTMAVLHHHAPRGGLRVHGTRVVTRASSRARIRDRHLPHMSEAYLAMRYFSPRQVREMLAIRAFATLRIHGGWWRQGLKAGYGLAMLPRTLREIRQAEQGGRELLDKFPRIEPLSG
jgi:GT2 family glycosyltransferase